MPDLPQQLRSLLGPEAIGHLATVRDLCHVAADAIEYLQSAARLAQELLANHSALNDRLNEEAAERMAEVERLKACVQAHHDQKGDGRCHLDDDKLYFDTLGIDVDPYATALPPTACMLESCARYIRQRQHPEVAGSVRLPGDMTIAQLTAEVERLRSEAEARPAKKDRHRGMYQKFEIRRTDGSSEPGGKHEDCQYFVLDLDHDRFAGLALKAYSDACYQDYPALSAELRVLAAGLISGIIPIEDDGKEPPCSP